MPLYIAYTGPVGTTAPPTPISTGTSTKAVVLGTTATGYEGSVTSARHAALALVPPTTQWHFQWPLGREFRVAPSRFLRVRVTAPASVGAYAYVIWEE